MEWLAQPVASGKGKCVARLLERGCSGGWSATEVVAGFKDERDKGGGSE